MTVEPGRTTQAPETKAVLWLLLCALGACTPLLDLEGPCGGGPCDAAPAEPDAPLIPLDAAVGDGPPDAAPPDTAPPDAGPDAAPLDAEVDATPLDAALRADCPSACDHLNACLARADVCPALAPPDRRHLAAQCVEVCSPEIATTILSQPCDSIEQLVRGAGGVLPADCHADSAPLPAGTAALARFTTLRPATDGCAFIAGTGAAFVDFAATLQWDFAPLLDPILPGFPGPALILSLEGWPAGTTANQAGEVQAIVWLGQAGGDAVQLEMRLGQLPAWVNGGHLAAQPGALSLPVPALPMADPAILLPLKAARIHGAVEITEAGLGLPNTFVTGYLDTDALVVLATQLKARCTPPGPLQLEACARLDLRGTPDEIAGRLWAGLTPDVHLPDDGPPMPCADDDCNAASVCLQAALSPAQID